MSSLALSSSAMAQQSPVPDQARQRVQPVVIHDGGGEPIGQYLANVTQDQANRQPRPRASNPTAMAIFPVSTTKAAVGRLDGPKKTTLPNGPGTPICFVGDDTASRQWLQSNQAYLLKIQASCLVVSVRDQSAFARLQKLAGDVRLVPGSMDRIAEAAGIPLWPVLVMPDGTMKQ